MTSTSNINKLQNTACEKKNEKKKEKYNSFPKIQTYDLLFKSGSFRYIALVYTTRAI